MNSLPEMHQALLDDTTLAALVSDIDQLGQNIEVIPRQRARQMVAESAMTLSAAYDALRQRTLPAVQIRYNHQGQRWCDTLVSSHGGWQLTRINLSEGSKVDSL